MWGRGKILQKEAGGTPALLFAPIVRIINQEQCVNAPKEQSSLYEHDFSVRQGDTCGSEKSDIMTPAEKLMPSNQSKINSAAAIYGAVVGVISGLVLSTPTKMYDIVLFTLVGLMVLAFSVAFWFRTRFLLIPLAGLVGALWSSAQVAAFFYPEFFQSKSPVWSGLPWVIPILGFGEYLWHKKEWKAWEKNMSNYSLKDILLLRHIPKYKSKP